MSKIKKLCLSTCVVLIMGSNFAFGMMDDDERRPAEHRCPITIGVMTDPVVAADGHSYERAAILQHFKINGAKSPSTGLPLKNVDLFDNHALKVMINEWKIGRQSEPSELETRDARSIAQRVKEEFRRNADLLNPEKGSQGQHIVAFLGNTGAGKSTLVNLLAGKKLRVSPDEEDYILDNSDDSTAMVIGHGGRSETLYPKSIDVDGLRFFDLPGFNDTDGSERNLVNAAFIRKILLDAESVRFVYVAGQDQFTADRSASVKHLFNSIKQLFVVDQGMDLTDNGIFVATKITCAPQTDIIDFLLKKTNSNDKAELNQQLQSWHQSQKLCRMFHPLREKNNRDVRGEILSHIIATKPTKVLGINVSALYPPDTKSSLERMFLNVMEETLNRKLATPLTTLSEYDRAILHYSDERFWETFNVDLCRQEDAIGLLKDFCINPYNKALRSFEKENEENRLNYIESLRKKRQWRVDDIRTKTESKARKVISSLIPQESGDDFVFFDFAYHRDYYDQVCGANSINQLSTDLTEQEIVRQQYADFISRHSHDQMMRWHQKFSGFDELTRELTLMKEELKRLKAPEVERTEIIESPIPARPRPIPAVARPRVAIPAVARPRVAIPAVARGYEEIYERFLKGVLIYRPQEGSDEGKIEMPIANLANPLEGTFDLSKCGDAGKYLSIATGYRKGKKAENANKLEIWLAPQFLIEKELLSSASHFRDIMETWNAQTAPIGVFLTWGGWSNLKHYDYVTLLSTADLSSKNFYDLWTRRLCLAHQAHPDHYGQCNYVLCARNRDKYVPPLNIEKFHVHFVN